MRLNTAQALTRAIRCSCRVVCLHVFFAGFLVLSVQADTLRLTDGTVLTGDVRQVTDSIIEVKTDGKVRFISINLLQPDDRARFENETEPAVETADGPDAPADEAPANATAGEAFPGPTAGVDAIPQDRSWDGVTKDIPTLTRTAFSTDTAQETRERAAEMLHRQGYDGPVDPLIEQMGSTDEMVFFQALRVMKKMPSLRMLEPILSQLGEDGWLRPEKATLFAEIIAGMGPQAVPLVIEASRQFDHQYDFDLIKAMGYLDDPRMVDHLLQLSEELEDGYSREAAYESLARIGTPEAVEAIIGPLCHAVETDRTENLDSMWAILLLGELGDERGVEPLIHALERENQPSGSQYAIAESLVKIKDCRAFGPLVSKLRSSNMEMRHLAAEALGGLGDPAALKPLMSLMVYLDADLRMTAAVGIGRIGDLRTAGVLIGYLDAASGDEETYEPLQGLGELGGKRACRAIRDRMDREPADGLTAYHGQAALDKIESAGTAEADVSASRTSLWHLSCWLGFLGRWLVIAILWFRLIANPARDHMDRTARKPAWFERFLLVTLAGLCGVRLLYVLVFHLNPGVLELVFFTGMPLARYVLSAVMDPLVVLIATWAILRRRNWGWSFLFAYIPVAILLSRLDYGYWTAVMIIGGCAVLVAFGARLLAEKLSLRPVTEESDTGPAAGRPSRFRKPFLTALVLLNSARLLISVAVSVAAIGFFMTWGYDELSIVLGILAAAVGGVADAALVYLVNKLALLLICRARKGRAWIERTVDGVSGLVLFGLCLLALLLLASVAIENSGSAAETLLTAGLPLFLVAAVSIYPLLQVLRDREQKILRYFVVATIVAYFLAQPLARLWITKLQ